MGLYPVAMDLSGRRCVVIGGGAVAETKVEGLLAAGASVTVVSPELTAALWAAVDAGRIDHVPRAYRSGDLDGAALAIAATDSPVTNAAVAREGRRRAVWVNAADDPAHCDFILPAVLRRGELVIAVSTSGASPALAAAVRDEVAGRIGEEYATLTEVARDVRTALRRDRHAVAARTWRAALRDAELHRLIAEGRREDASARLRARLEAACA